MKAKIALFVLFVSIPLARSEASQMPASPTPLVSVLPATPANLPLLDSAIVPKFHPDAFIIANNSEHAVVGLAVQWKYTAADGRPRTFNHKTDSFMLVVHRNPVIGVHERLLVAPGAFVQEVSIGKEHLIGTPVDLMDGSREDSIEGATDITVTVDVIIFDDGQVVGANTTHYDTEIQNRKLAAAAVAQQLRNAIANGADPKETLDHITSSTPFREDTFARWTVKYARGVSLGLEPGQARLHTSP